MLAADGGTAATEADHIRSLEAQQLQAVATGNFQALETLWSEHLLVNNVAGKLNTNRAHVLASLGPVAERRIEHIHVVGDIAVVMGSEMGQPRRMAHCVEGRFSHVWQRENDGWRLLVRHAMHYGASFCTVSGSHCRQ